MARASRGKGVKKSLKFLIYGTSGSRKSSRALDFMRMTTENGRPFRVLYLDIETGSVDYYLDDLEAEGIDTDNIYIVYTSSYDELEYYCNKAIKNEEFYELNDDGEETDQVVLDADGKPFIPDAIVIDGITVVADNVKQSALNVAEKRAGVRAKVKGLIGDEKAVMIETASLEFKDFDRIKNKGRALVRNLVTNTNKSICITARDKEEKVMKTDGKNNMQLVNTGNRVIESWDFIKYEVFTVIHTYVDDANDECYAIIEHKDRTGICYPQQKLNDDWSLTMWQPVLDNNKGKKEHVIHDSYEEGIAKDEKMYAKIDGEETLTNNSSTKAEPTAQDYHLMIKEALSKVPPQKKRSLGALVTSKGLPKKYEDITDVNTLKEYYKLITG